MPADIRIHCSTQDSFAKEAEDLFGCNAHLPRTAVFKKSTLCIILPHAVSNGSCGKILDVVMSHGFECTDLHMLKVSREDAAEFLEVYKGIVSDYHSMVEQLSSGKCIALYFFFFVFIGN